MFGNLTWFDVSLFVIGLVTLVVIVAARLSDKWAAMIMEKETKAEFEAHVRSAIKLANTKN